MASLGLELVEIEQAGRGLLRVTIDRPVPPDVAPDTAADAPAAAVANLGVEAVTAEAGLPMRDEAFVTVEDCERVTRHLQVVLEVEGVDYARLEVSSPGLDRLLRHAADFQRFAGAAVSLTLREPFEGRRHWQGRLLQPEPAAPSAANEAVAASGDESVAVPVGVQAEPLWRLVFQQGKVEQVLAFSLSEVREARLVPVLNFKGRGARGASPAGGRGASVGATDAVDGG